MTEASALIPATLLIGNPRTGSRTYSIAEQATKMILAGLADEGVQVDEPTVVDLAELGPVLPARMSSAVPLESSVGQALAAVSRPGLLIVVSPTFKGSYSGLLKLFLDMLPINGLAGTVAVAVMTAGWPKHRSAVDMYLKPLLTELAANTPVPGLSIIEEEFADLDTVVRPWASASIPALAAVVARMHGETVPAAYAESLSSRVLS